VEKERHTQKVVETRVKAGASVELNVELQYDPEPRTGKAFTSGHGLRMQWIPWLQGWAAAVETTQAAYEAVTHENPSEQKSPELPVTNVTWAQAMKFCDLLTIAERGLGFLPEGYAYALPSDEEWSRLAKDTPLTQAATSLNAPREGPAAAGSLAANGLGLKDLRGNVWEWCRDSYTAEVHRKQMVENATGDPSRINQRYKVLRGGSWNRTSESNLGLGFRLAADGNSHSDYETGFRVVLLRTP
jgi:formylglycine-generating enzyme required for sulfatase activity